jgi:hypothetical protein
MLIPNGPWWRQYRPLVVVLVLIGRSENVSLFGDVSNWQTRQPIPALRGSFLVRV